MNEIQIRVTLQELAAVLAALRFYEQECTRENVGRHLMLEIASDGGRIEPLPLEAIDHLCEKINYS